MDFGLYGNGNLDGVHLYEGFVCFIIVMKRNELELEGRRRYIINTPFISKHVLSSPFKLHTHR